MKNRIRLGNRKDKYIKPILPTSISTVSELITYLNSNGFYADIDNNNETAGDNAGITEAGTALNKANLLSDEVASALGLNLDDPSVNDAFGAVKFDNIVAPGGTMTGNLSFPNGKGISGFDIDGEPLSIIKLDSNKNVQIGPDEISGMQNNNNVRMQVGNEEYAYIKRDGISPAHKLLDYSFVFQQLFSGSFSSGSITVPGLSKYHLFYITFAGDNTGALAVRKSNTIRGIGGFGSASDNPWITTVGLSFDGDDLTYGNIDQFYINSSTKGISDITTGKTIVSIYGILGIEANV